MSPGEDRVALVTGAARGIGAATVLALAAAGWRVVAVDGCADDPDLPYAMGSRAELDAVVAAAARAAAAGAGAHGAGAGADGAGADGAGHDGGAGGGGAGGGGAGGGGAAGRTDGGGPAPAGGGAERGGGGLGRGGPRVVGVQADVRDADALAAAVGQAEDRWGGLDAALAVAGVIAGGVPAWQVPVGQEQAVLDIDLGGVLNLARVSVPALLRRPEPRHGRFLAVASAAATRGLPMLAAYCAAKAGVAGFIRALAVELGGTGITANAVSPGSTATPILDESARLYDLPGAGVFAAQQPLGRLLEPAEVAAVLAFLAGDGARAMTGAVVPVDGGLAL
jgi:SDR family mycofactocin-dependent oxidoreductase